MDKYSQLVNIREVNLFENECSNLLIMVNDVVFQQKLTEINQKIGKVLLKHLEEQTSPIKLTKTLVDLK